MKNTKDFDMFSPKMKSFFSELTLNNNKAWFDDNRSLYETEIRDKTKSFVLKMNDIFLNNEMPYIADTKISTFRINRDIRFSKDKNPYKTNLGVIFPYCENPMIFNKEFTFGLYVHYEAGQSFIAIGVHSPDSPTLKNIRHYIAENYEELTKIVGDKDFRIHFPEEYASQEPLKRVQGFPQDHPAGEFLKKKEFSYGAKFDDNIFFTNELIPFIIEKCVVSVDYMSFFYKAIYQQ